MRGKTKKMKIMKGKWRENEENERKMKGKWKGKWQENEESETKKKNEDNQQIENERIFF